MTAILDENAPARLSGALSQLGRLVLPFPADWKGLKNGELLARLLKDDASCLITCDRNLHRQQNVARSGLAVVVLPKQRFQDLRPILTAIVAAIDEAAPGGVLLVGADGVVRRG